MADEKDDRAYVSVGIGGRPKLDREVFDPERNPLTGRAVASLPDETGRMRYGLPDNEDRIASCRFGSRRSVFIRSAIRRRANTSRADCRILSICGRGRSSPPVPANENDATVEDGTSASERGGAG